MAAVVLGMFAQERHGSCGLPKSSDDDLALEVVVTWGDSVQRVEHLGDGASFLLPVESADATDAAPAAAVIARVARRCARFMFLRGAVGEVVSGGVVKTLDTLTREGAAVSQPDDARLLGLSLAAADRARVLVGALEVRVGLVVPERRATRARRADVAMRWAGLAAVFIVGTLITAMRVARVTDPRLDSLDLTEASLARIRHIMAFASDRIPQERLREDTRARVWSSPIGRAHEATSGTMGRPDALQRDRRYTLARRGLASGLARPPARDQVVQRGIFAAIGSVSSVAAGHGPVSPFGGLVDAGHDSNTAAGRMTAQFMGDAFGYSGLGRAGEGFGGGGLGEGTIGLAAMGRIGRGWGTCGCGDDVGLIGFGRLDGAGLRGTLPRRTASPTLPPGLTRGPPRVCGGSLQCDRVVTEGALSSGVIRRVILRNLGQVRHCQEQGLTENPGLSGRVTIRFVIGTDGAVAGAGIAESSVQVATVASCIASAVRRWTFPAPAGGVVTVVYPFTLQAAE